MMQIPSREHFEALKVSIHAPDMTWDHYLNLVYVMSDEAVTDLRQAMADLRPQKEVMTPQWAANLCIGSVFGIPITLVTLAPFIGIEAWGAIALTLTWIFVVSLVLSLVFTREVG